MVSSYGENAKVFKALCDEKRLRILELLQDGERCVCTLHEPLGLPQSTLSYHLRILCESGIVAGRQEGKWTYYHISQPGSRAAAQLLAKLTSVAPERAPRKTRCTCAT
ncbi:MAG: metalloregulator ArsR/SmtB family transcription factor [Eubacteriales bacterium]|jgi:ArsR family transcriptional regulator|nr:metalloregulator ArsR/SmtB family transcription factor [Eubacteriales bacterium]